jgi:tRNA threonylcarbamoyl adenosine modification protein (Sua5/YciO/YrdC/YwlC family)
MFRLLKAHLPGPFTFILPAGKQVPKLLQTKKSTIGIRVPDNKICLMLLEQLGHPIISTSLPGEWVEDYTDPEMMQENFGNKVDIILDGGIGGITPSTVVDYTGDEPIIVRQGAGILEI